jgi:hypothetical protein
MSLREHYPAGFLDLPGGLSLRFSTRTDDEEYCGAIFEHPTSTTESGRCSGAIWFEGQGHGHPEWRIESENPLTLSPSLLCHCGYHGFIREGKWVSA